MLTKRQRDFFQFLCHYQDQYGYPPSYSDITHHFGFKSDGTVTTYLNHLVQKGYIQRTGKARSITLLKKSSAQIPILGNIAAGTPLFAEENFQGILSNLPPLQFKDHRFGLKIKGDSMKDIGILEDDIVIIDQKNSVRNGQIAAVLVDEEATLKRVFFTTKSIKLVSENSIYSPMVYPIDKIKILGVYIGL